MRGIPQIYFILLLLLGYNATGQTFSYLYIQGDKETPIYVKLEDEMQPRYGKNYCIISQLAPGPVHIQILFQQNVYPPQNFILQVPEKGYRGFIVSRKGDDIYLYDLQKKIYLPAGASVPDSAPAQHPANLSMPVSPSVVTPEPVTSIAAGAVVTLAPRSAAPAPDTDEEIRTKKAHIDSLIKAHNNKPKQPAQPQFIDNMVLDNSRTLPVARQPADHTADITNSDCPAPMDNTAFDDIFVHMMEKTGDARLKYLSEHIKHCFSCDQVQMLARNLDSDPQRYAFMKQVYPHISDQANFKYLETLYSSAEWKSYFKLIVQ